MDGRGRFLDNIFIEWLWRSLKYEAVYLHELRDGLDAERIIGTWVDFYAEVRPHSPAPVGPGNAAVLGPTCSPRPQSRSPRALETTDLWGERRGCARVDSPGRISIGSARMSDYSCKEAERNEQSNGLFRS